MNLIRWLFRIPKTAVRFGPAFEASAQTAPNLRWWWVPHMWMKVYRWYQPVWGGVTFMFCNRSFSVSWDFRYPPTAGDAQTEGEGS